MSGARSRHLPLPREVDAHTAALVHMVLKRPAEGVTVLDASLTESMTTVAAHLLAVSLEDVAATRYPVIVHLSPAVADGLGDHPVLRFAATWQEEVIVASRRLSFPEPAASQTGYTIPASS